MTLTAKNIILIGMPGAGKSTIGSLLAKQLGKDFVDTDLLIQQAHNRSLQEIIDKSGYLRLRQYEEQILINLTFTDKVVATGGSTVYSDSGMQRLRANGVIVFLDLNLEELKRRVTNFNDRGIARRTDQSVDELYAERRPLYQQYADITLDCTALDIQKTLQSVVKSLDNQ